MVEIEMIYLRCYDLKNETQENIYGIRVTNHLYVSRGICGRYFTIHKIEHSQWENSQLYSHILMTLYLCEVLYLSNNRSVTLYPLSWLRLLRDLSEKCKKMKNKFPKINFIGNKEKIAHWILDYLPKDAGSIFDAFSGGWSIGYEAKKRGLKVISNDILNVNYMISKSLIENHTEQLTPADVDTIFTGNPSKWFMWENYANIFFYPEECMELDLYRENIDKLSSEYKKSLALTLMRRAMIRKMPYSRFNINWGKIRQLRDEVYSYEKYWRKRAYHNQDIKSHFLENLDAYNDAIFDNYQTNIALHDDIFNLLETTHTDVIYLDPPYTGTMNNYFGFYGLLDSYITSTKQEAFANNFIEKNKSIELFEKLFSRLGNYKYWFLSYNNSSYPSKEELLSIIGRYSREVEIIEKPHTYKVTWKEKKKKNSEYLFIAKNPTFQQ